MLGIRRPRKTRPRLNSPHVTQKRRQRLRLSYAAHYTSPGSYQAVYNASKSFVRSFALALREEQRDSGVTVTTLMAGIGARRCLIAYHKAPRARQSRAARQREGTHAPADGRAGLGEQVRQETRRAEARR